MNIWNVQHRLFAEQLDALLDTDELPEELLRIIAAARVLLAQHHVDKQGRCNRCYYRPRWWWLRGRKTCTVHVSFSVAMNQPLGTVWRWTKDWCKLTESSAHSSAEFETTLNL
ncbi:MAG: hypothetical protein ACREX3_13725 [Gammaproteobacteria bacterium]